MEKTQIRTRQLGTTGLEISPVGFRRPDQVDAIPAAASLRLTDGDVDEIEGRH